MIEASPPPVAGWLVDPEVYYKRRPAPARRLLDLTLDALSERLRLGHVEHGQSPAARTCSERSYCGTQAYFAGSPRRREQTLSTPAGSTA